MGVHDVVVLGIGFNLVEHLNADTRVLNNAFDLIDHACAAQTGGHEQDLRHPRLGGGDADHLVRTRTEQGSRGRMNALDREKVHAADIHAADHS